ncbi:sensor histidine kinase [Aestuariibacter salexigens]|uniref:sensor histidine kinase n=1 Tax=Aestuariibacter salexigens TaxID=226010 RepID=UPI0003F63577|nr:HAMP domain-containing sensor histidine kinase [Aestuariibacter salexigens]
MFFGIDTSSFMPHGHCILWKPELLFPIVASEILIFIAYTSIPVAIYIFQQNRPDLNSDSKKLLILFFLFIQLCGITHLISAYNYWNSAYVLAMFVKVATAIVSVVTAFMLFKLLPRLIKLPSPTEHLKLIEELKILNSQLEEKIQERTALIMEQKNLLETLVEGCTGSILKYEPIIDDGKIVDFHSSIVFGKAASEAGVDGEEQIVGESVLNLFPDVVENGHFDSAIRAFNNNEQVIEDPVYSKALNKYFRVINFKKPEISFLLVYFTDVTQRELLKLDAINNSKLIILGELAGGIAHEINSPLQIISGSAEMLENSIDPEDKIGRKCLHNIDTTVARISDIIKNLKRLSRKESGKVGNVNICEVLKKSVQLYEQRIKLNDIHLIEAYENSSPNTVNTIELNVFQIVNNLLSNAIHALQENDGDRTLTISIEANGNGIDLIFTNNGPLIDHNIQERIFEPLFTTKDVGEGTGLGLSLSKRLAEEIQSELYFVQSDDSVSFVLKVKNIDENPAGR